jgi:hypothetical protein
VAVVLAGCSSPGTSLESSPEVTLRSVGALLHNLVWSYRRHTLVALTDDHRLAEITDPLSPEHAKTWRHRRWLSQPFFRRWRHASSGRAVRPWALSAPMNPQRVRELVEVSIGTGQQMLGGHGQVLPLLRLRACALDTAAWAIQVGELRQVQAERMGVGVTKLNRGNGPR